MTEKKVHQFLCVQIACT